MARINPEESLRVLERAIQKGQIDTSSWGKGTTKTRGHLEKEIAEGDTTLTHWQPPEGQDVLLRHVTAANVYVFARRRDLLGRVHVYQLKEDWQKFYDRPFWSNTKRRGHFWISEKMHPEESAAEGAQRALREELGIMVSVERFTIPNPNGKKKKIRPSKTYPGLFDQKRLIPSSVVLEGKEVRRRYYDRQEDKITRFSWVRVDKVKRKKARIFTA